MRLHVEKRGEYGEDIGGGAERCVHHREVLQHAVSREEEEVGPPWWWW